jgi:acetyl esterase/lipase
VIEGRIMGLNRVAWSCLVTLLAATAKADDPKPMPIWPANKAPGDSSQLGDERDTTKPGDNLVAGKSVQRIGNVSVPTIAVYPPSKGTGETPAIVICPGGGHHILAYDLEGTEVAQWLNSIGVTAVVLKYRVPARDPHRRWLAAVQDAQRAMSLVRSNSKDWKIDPKRIGILGFSAGGETAALTAILDQRQYERQDAVDDTSSRPDFMVLVYPGGLANKDGTALRDYVRVTKSAPPAFLVHAGDDRLTSEHSVLFYLALKRAGVPAEIHVYAAGGHGFGLRRTETPVTNWPDACEKWLRAAWSQASRP